jgi:hypothetical protein
VKRKLKAIYQKVLMRHALKVLSRIRKLDFFSAYKGVRLFYYNRILTLNQITWSKAVRTHVVVFQKSNLDNPDTLLKNLNQANL